MVGFCGVSGGRELGCIFGKIENVVVYWVVVEY
jgi:hypothetical protein